MASTNIYLYLWKVGYLLSQNNTLLPPSSRIRLPILRPPHSRESEVIRLSYYDLFPKDSFYFSQFILDLPNLFFYMLEIDYEI